MRKKSQRYNAHTHLLVVLGHALPPRAQDLGLLSHGRVGVEGGPHGHGEEDVGREGPLGRVLVLGQLL